MEGDPGLAAGPRCWPLRPALSLAPDGRPGFSGPSVWDWLEELAWLFFVGTPLIYREVLTDNGRTTTFDGWPQVGYLIPETDFPLYWWRRRQVQADEADRVVRRIRRFQEETPWGLEVGTAEQIAQNWMPGGLQVTIWWDGIFRVSRRDAPVELMLDLTRYQWMVVRGGGLWNLYAARPAPRHWRSAYGN